MNGFRVEARGEVRVAYPGLGMGIFFTTMSDEDRERLRELLKSTLAALGDPEPAWNSNTRPQDFTSRQLWLRLRTRGLRLQAMLNFFEDRHILAREEFFQDSAEEPVAGLEFSVPRLCSQLRFSVLRFSRPRPKLHFDCYDEILWRFI